ncbi:hypothetical protein KZP23_05975 [Echinicola marina]|uniref:hypothetical protein n=1 Tax=Echinicola marina TaxID=2859768 RepID=UPI001CF6B912|nr:hypothetical protein [Echinicola marina]UCS94567.1 hypothetical protein KZP23_05975 [Echinicola marina]
MSGKQPIFTPELVKVIKIFGLLSIGIVLFFSFFNDYRADNSGDAGQSHITDASRLYFKNMRRYYYDMEKQDEAKLDIFRYSKRLKEENLPFINLSIIISRIKDKAFIYLEPSTPLQKESEIQIRWKNLENDTGGILSFIPGDRHSHFDFVAELAPLIEDEIVFEVKIDGHWQSILDTEKERYAFKVTAEDYFRLIE